VLVVTHYMEEQIRDYFGDGSHLGIEISYKKQAEMKGTANAIGVAEDFMDEEDFIAVYGDLFLSSVVFKTLVTAHRGGETSLCVSPIDDPSAMGVVELDADRVMRIIEKPVSGEAPSNLANAGVYVFNNGIFDAIRDTKPSERHEYEITDSINALISSGSVARAVSIPQDAWLDVGLPWNLLDANTRALSAMESKVDGEIANGTRMIGPVRIEEGASIRDGAYIEGPVYIGADSDIGPNCYIRPSTSIGANVRIGNACEVKNSIILDGTHVAHLSYIGDSFIGAGCNLGAGTITANIRFDKKNVKVNIKGAPIDSGRRKLGAIMGDNAQTGINVGILPGVKIGSEAWIAPGLTVHDNVPSGMFLRESGLKSRREIGTI
ncbi:MAG: glucose-1-phosphate thymidylyltransferase, partial [Candidatus Bathyarchaeota archaeon]